MVLSVESQKFSNSPFAHPGFEMSLLDGFGMCGVCASKSHATGRVRLVFDD